MPSPLLEVEYEEPEEIDHIRKLIIEETPLYDEIKKKAEREVEEIRKRLERIRMLTKFKTGEVWITIIPEKPKEKKVRIKVEWIREEEEEEKGEEEEHGEEQ